MQTEVEVVRRAVNEGVDFEGFDDDGIPGTESDPDIGYDDDAASRGDERDLAQPTVVVRLVDARGSEAYGGQRGTLELVVPALRRSGLIVSCQLHRQSLSRSVARNSASQ